MKFLTFVLFTMIICSGIFPNVMAQTNVGRAINKLPVIDKEKTYPEKDFIPETETIYIPLETSKNILLDRGAHIYYVSDKRILITNWLKGDVLIFDLNGKAISHFNQKGGLGYVRISYAVYDEKNKEVFIMDKVSRKIVVFTEDGVYKRSFRMPTNLTFIRIDNYNDKCLLAFHEHAMGPIEQEQKQPYVIISKKDGSIFSTLNINLEKANPRYLLSGNICYSLSNTAMGNCKFGDDYYLSNISCDTIYHIDKNNNLTPVFTQYPSVFSSSHLISGVVAVTKDFIVLSIFPYDLEDEKKRNESGKSINGQDRTKFILYDKSTSKFFNCKKWKYVADNIDLPKNVSAELISAYLLKERLKQGLLVGKLKEVASKLKVEDNPVVEITKFN